MILLHLILHVECAAATQVSCGSQVGRQWSDLGEGGAEVLIILHVGKGEDLGLLLTATASFDS